MNLQEEIAKIAYELYEKSGRVGGRDLQNWIEAEKIVSAKYAAAKTAGKKKAPSDIKSPVAKTARKKATAEKPAGKSSATKKKKTKGSAS